MVSGASVPTERAFVMNGIVFAAMLIDRLRISMRICALAAMLVLLIDPASLVGVSFQMSFGAVVALIAAYETWGAQLARCFTAARYRRQVLGYLGAVAVTTVIATFGTEPFAIHHFHHFVLYSPLANVIAVPIIGDVDPAVGPRRLPADAVRPRAARSGADGLGHRRDDLDRAMGLRIAGQCVVDAAPADVRARADRARRVVAVPVAAALAGLGARRRSRPVSRRCC